MIIFSWSEVRSTFQINEASFARFYCNANFVLVTVEIFEGSETRSIIISFSVTILPKSLTTPAVKHFSVELKVTHNIFVFAS
jgi:hypothetical protein